MEGLGPPYFGIVTLLKISCSLFRESVLKKNKHSENSFVAQRHLPYNHEQTTYAGSS